MESKSYVFDPRPAFPLLVTARQYWTSDCSPDDPDAVSLVFAHSTGTHKEHWEPTLGHLFAHLRESGKAKIRDAWCIDAPNHGEAAILNEKELLWGYNQVFPWEEVARSVHLFLAGLGKGVDVDFSSRKLVGIGHSMGATVIILSQTYQPPLPYVSVILVDPMLIPPTASPVRNMLLEGAEKRRDIWPSREAAYAQFSSRPTWKAWDPRLLKIYVRYGLRELPTAEYPDKTEGVTLTCTKAQEAACFRDGLSRTKAYRYLPHLAAAIPVHFVWAGIPDMTDQVKDTVMAEGAGGRHASDQRVANSTHSIPQMQPRELADALWNALCMPRRPEIGSQLSSRL
ncbi:Alpha/beta hydrolase fold-1 [Trametes elegans]|nr:Alpha/beta hydrolase fold-1 [Trametes elegans]